MGNTSFTNVDLRTVRGLETLQHRYPSSVGIDTIERSNAEIPESFLRGASVAEPFITNIKALIGAMRPIQFYSCFISYSSEDHLFAEELHGKLQNKNLRVWFAPEDMKIGDRIRDQIDESIRKHDKLLLVLSERSIASPWVKREVEAAFEREDRERKAVLFPIRLNDVILETNEPWAAEIRRTRHIGDFRRWKEYDAYQKAFDRLLREPAGRGNKES